MYETALILSGTILVWAVARGAMATWQRVRYQDARARVDVAALRAERWRMDRDAAIASAVEAGVAAALEKHRAALADLEQDIRDARSRVAMGRK